MSVPNPTALDVADRIERALGGEPSPRHEPVDPVPPGLDEPPAPNGAAPAIPTVVNTPVDLRAKGKVAPTRAGQVVNPQDSLRIYKMHAGKQALINDYTVQEIAAGGGDLEGFILKVVAPSHGSGDYPVYKHDRGTLIYQGTVTVDVGAVQPTRTVVAPPAAPPAGASLRDTLEMSRMLSQDQAAAAAAAEAKVRADEARRKQDRDELLATFKGNAKESGASIAELMMLRTMLREDQPKEDPRINELGNMVADLTRQVQMLPSMIAVPPPPPPAAPAPSAVEVASGIVAALSPIVGTVVGALQASAASKPKLEDYVGMATTIVAALATAGIIGGKKEPDAETVALRTRLDMMLSQESPDPLEQITKIVAVVDALRPKPDGAKDILTVIDHTINRLPDVLDSVGRVFAARGPASTTPMITMGTGEKVPVAFAKMRSEVESALKIPQERERAVAIVRASIGGLAETYKAGGAWYADCQELLVAATAQQIDAVRVVFARLVRRAWPKTDAGSKVFYDAVMDVWRQFPAEIAAILTNNGGKGKPEAAAQTTTVDNGDDLLTAEGDEAVLS